MTDEYPLSRKRTKTGLGIWEHRGKVAVAGIGFAPTMRRWDGRDMSTAVGALTIVAAQKALDDAGIGRGEIDGVVSCPIGMGDSWGPSRPYFAPPYNTEDGLSGTSADWLVKNMGLWNARTTFHAPACFSMALTTGAQVVGEGLAHTILVIRGMGNPPGRYHQMPTTHYSGPAQWTAPWDWRLEPLIAYGFDLYCRKYNTTHDRVAPFVLNQRRNGLMMPEGYYSQHRPDSMVTVKDYQAARWIVKPMSIMDMDLPIQTAVAFVLTTSERAGHMKQKPVYVLNHCSQRGKVRSTTETLEETEAFSDNIAQMCYEGSGLTPGEVDIFNPYDGYTLFSQYFLEAFHWHGVKKGEAHDFYAGDISVEGPHPFCSSGGNNGNGRTRAWGHYDCIQQLRGQAGKRQVRIKAETAIAGSFTPGMSDWMVYSTSPD